MRASLSALVVLIVFLIAAPAASAEVGIEFEWDRAGNPTLGAATGSVVENGPPLAIVEWRTCPPDGTACVPLPASSYRPRDVCRPPHYYCQLYARPGETPAGTVFEAVFDVGGSLVTRRTSVWTGRAHSSEPVTISKAVVGRVAEATSGGWTGGWEPTPGGVHRVGYTHYACSDPSGTDCYVIAPGGPLIQRWAGWYLIVRAARVFQWPGASLFPRVVSVPAAFPFRVGALTPAEPSWTSSAPTPICCVLAAPPEQTTTPRPAASSAQVRSVAQRRRGALHVARVSCRLRCAVRLTVTGGGGPIARSLSVRGTRSLSIPPRRGVLRVSVFVDGKRLVSGRSRAR